MSEQEEGRRKEKEGRRRKERKKEGRKEGRKEGEGSATTRRIDSDDCIFIKGDNKHEHLNNIVLHRRQKDIYKTVFT